MLRQFLDRALRLGQAKGPSAAATYSSNEHKNSSSSPKIV